MAPGAGRKKGKVSVNSRRWPKSTRKMPYSRLLKSRREIPRVPAKFLNLLDFIGSGGALPPFPTPRKPAVYASLLRVKKPAFG